MLNVTKMTVKTIDYENSRYDDLFNFFQPTIKPCVIRHKNLLQWFKSFKDFKDFFLLRINHRSKSLPPLLNSNPETKEQMKMFGKENIGTLSVESM